MNHYACLLCDELVRERESKAFIPDTNFAPRGVPSSSDGENERDVTKVRVCDKFFRSIQQESPGPGDSLNPPKFSIANGSAIGSLPVCLKDATITENRLISLASFSLPILIARGGSHRAIRDNVFAFDSYPQEI